MLVITERIIVLLIFLLAIPIGGIFLQIYLSKQESKLLGLILPTITFAISLLIVLNMVAFTGGGTFTQSEYIDGEWITTTTSISEGDERTLIPGAVGGIIYTFILTNIPTVILLIICHAVRSRQNRRREVEKMSIQDL